MVIEVPFTFRCLTVGVSLLATSPQKSRASSLPHFPTASFRIRWNPASGRAVRELKARPRAFTRGAPTKKEPPGCGAHTPARRHPAVADPTDQTQVVALADQPSGHTVPGIGRQ